ncbi:unnamed protein product [Dibothriocephalus latus]|uniref:Uncharacterized protein n=1 Tax=Dibothriocephalus latus TaxID=60516 RepID=A0A3P7P175_DIBLA|nr:unnamed protein product [Dibothriocephalus latus]
MLSRLSAVGLSSPALGTPYVCPFRVVSGGLEIFRIQRQTCEEVMSMDRLKAAVSKTLLDEPFVPLSPASPPFPPLRDLQLPPPQHFSRRS